ncbi:hypothetical protein IWQ61_000550 [Dispira simplex]|nr:hypothetical protein IWQ61_000550 [Dispira simplex]
MAQGNPRTEVLSLFRSFLRASRCFESYNFREYVHRRARDAFKQHRNETDADTIQALIRKAQNELDVVERQALINSIYSHGKLVVE